MSGESHDELDARMRALGELIAEIERSCTPAAAEPARELLRAVLAVHESGLRVLIGELQAAGAVEPLRAACRNPGVASLLLMHELHPEPLRERVLAALAQANAAARAGARAELTALEGERVHVTVRVEAGDSGAGLRLRAAVEQLLCELAPDAQLELSGGNAPPAPALVPASRLLARIGAARG